MTTTTTIAIVVAILIVLAMVGGYIHPLSRPYVRKWGWLVVVPLAFLAGVVLVTGRRRREEGQEGDGGQAAGDASKAAVKALADRALAMSADADADLEERRLVSEAKTTVARADLEEYRQAVTAARAIDDAAARRAALVALVESK